MNKILIEYIIDLFSIISNIYSTIPRVNVKDFISLFLRKEFDQYAIKEFLIRFDKNFDEYQSYDNKKLSRLLIQKTNEVNDKLPKLERFILLIRLLLFNKFLLRYPFRNDSEIHLSDLLKQISVELNINYKEYIDCKSFIEEKLYNLQSKENLLLISKANSFSSDIRILERQSLNGQLLFYIIRSVNLIIFYYRGYDNITLNEQIVFPENIYFLPKGSAIRCDNQLVIYYNEILRQFLSENLTQINFSANNIDFHFKNSNNGIHNLSLFVESGQLVGVIGRSGVGKSTLLNLLNGNTIPQKGMVKVNAYNVNRYKSKLDGLIGYIPQDDLLIEELSVFRNLFLNARLCFGTLSKIEIINKVEDLLKSLDLYEVKDLKVGSPLNKFISGGQRKRLNIALELIREPHILFADEPTSGLSSSDSEEIMQLLSKQALSGKIVVINIHQPSSEVFKLFDKILLLDKEGYPVYFGNPAESISYFNNLGESFITFADTCQRCGNINSESIFKILEERKVNEKGEFINLRKVLPQEWHKHYKTKLSLKFSEQDTQTDIPKVRFKKPNFLKQYMIFFERNLLSKIANRQYVLLSILITPVLSVILSFLCKQSNHDFESYVLFGNDNIPAYLFMGVIVALFVGLIISAEDIYRDRKILKREAFLRLNKISYLRSKISFLFGLSALQAFLYVLFGNWILEIKGMLFLFWIILFSTFCFANITGLLISTIFNSVIVIYILVPLFIVPQILLSGTMISYDKLNHKVVNKKYVPLVGDIMASRWAYESLIVAQFRDNKYQDFYFNLDKQDSRARFNVLFLIPELKKAIRDLFEILKDENSQKKKQVYTFLKNEIEKLNTLYPFVKLNTIRFSSLSYSDLILIENYLNKLNAEFTNIISQISYKKDSITYALVNKFGGVDSYNEFKNLHSVKSLSELVLKRQSFVPYVKTSREIIQKIDPIYHISDSSFGRAHFFASEKKVGNRLVDTITYNVIAIWLMTILSSLFLCIIFYKKY
ncbi:MAG: ATP-binding cassette domain-containing protein [Bacteroidales bacterium]|nr:ATP-binding cassette domain-containing protein [Bacteroidales bacterium]